MSAVDRVVIVGAGQAGGDLAAALRERGYAGRISVLGRESHLPYSRPPLSKAYLLDEVGYSDLALRGPATYDRHDIEITVGTTVISVDRADKSVLTEAGARYDYGVLVLATGGTARNHPDPRLQCATPNVFQLRTIDDVERLRRVLTPETRMAVLGGGWVGLEVAAVARQIGAAVTVIERDRRLLARVASPVVSDFFARLHRERGVDVRLGSQVVDCSTTGDGAVSALHLDDGSTVQCDVCLVAIGLVPETELASACGLTVDDGVLVDEHLRTSDPAIYAIGDVARHPCAERGGHRRLESVASAGEQARAVANAIVGASIPAPTAPWFWSDQYHVKFQSVGLPAEGDEIVLRGDPASEKFCAFYLRDGAVRAADAISSPREFAAAKKIVAGRLPVDARTLASTAVSLAGLAKR